MSAKYDKPLRTDAELTFDRIVRDIERLQIEKVAELLGKATYRKMAIITTTIPAQTGYYQTHRQARSEPF